MLLECALPCQIDPQVMRLVLQAVVATVAIVLGATNLANEW